MRILYNDGEGLEHSDLNLQKEISLRHLFDSILANFAGRDQVKWATDGSRNTVELRPLGNAGIALVNGTTTIDVLGGLWLELDYDAALSLDGPTAKIAHSDAITNLTGFVATSAGELRRDIIQARLVDSNDASVNRDFKDGITGALSTQTLAKRQRFTMEYQRKAGVEGTTGIDLDYFTSSQYEPVADAGWTKIGSVLCDDGGIYNNLIIFNFDYRKPWGYSRAQVGYWGFHSSNPLQPAPGGNSTRVEPTVALSRVVSPFPWGENQQGNATNEQYAPIRIEELVTTMTLTNRLTDDVLIGNMPVGQLAPGGSGAYFTRPDASENYIHDDAGQRPLWSNGSFHPIYGLFFGTSTLGVLSIQTRSLADDLSGYTIKGWGGF